MRVLLAVIPALILWVACGEDHSHDLMKIGEHSVFRPPSEMGAVADSEEVYGKWLDSCSAEDNIGQFELVSSGRVALVDAGTRILILDYGRVHFTSLYKFRIVEGKSFGKAAWAPQQYFKRDTQAVTQ